VTVDRIQDGIYFRSKQRPPACFRLLTLNVTAGAAGAEVRIAVDRVVRLLELLKSGDLADLVGTGPAETRVTAETFSGLDVLVGFGRRLFDGDEHDPPLVRAPRPEGLIYLTRDRAAFPGLPWDFRAPAGNPGEADILLQLTGPTEAAVNRAAVEVWKLAVDEGLPLEPFASFSGFQRPDGRGWLEFHDGVSNMPAGHRLEAIAAQEPEWMTGGTFMAFLRLAVDLQAWRLLSRAQQELVIGRDKLSGAPLIRVRRESGGDLVPVAAPSLTDTPTDLAHADYADPPQTTDPLLEASHTHRANQNRASPFVPAGLRIFRQGYDFLDDLGPDGPILGLNFVSFQGDLGSLQHLLHLPGWLGDVNFGGPTDPGPGDPPSPQMITVLSGGLYAIPPLEDPFPGAEVFATA
jgi:deferrochelatase/peroxidase EfeB